MGDGAEIDDLAAGFRVGDWLAEPSLNRISREGEDVAVEPKVMEVLVCLARNPGSTVTKDFFFETVWDGMVVTEDVLSRCISELRKNLGDDSRDPTYIETIRKTGYRLIAPVSDREPGITPDLRRRQPTVRSATDRATYDGDGSADGAPKRRLLSVTRGQAGVVIAVLLFLGFYLVYSRLTANTQTSVPVPETVPFTSLPGLEIDPAFSPDGQKIAFASDDNALRNFDIFIKQEGSDKALRITEDAADERFPAWSPDGLFLAFVRTESESNDVFTIPSLGGQERRVAAFGSRRIQGVSWSPDGSELAVSVQREPFGAFSIFLVRVDTASVRRITTPPHYDHGDVGPRFSPDGKAIAFMRGVSTDVQDVFIYRFETREARQITFDSTATSGLDWTPDGSSIIFASTREHANGLWRVSASGGEPYPLISAGPGVSLEYPSISPDGKRISYVDLSANVNVWRLFKPEGFPSLRARPAVFSTYWDSHPDISPDGLRIAFASTQSGDREIWVADANGENQTQITSTNGRAKSPRWSPDGTQLAFQWRNGGQADVYLVDVDGGRPRRLTKSLFEDTVPMWSRDGNYVYFASNRSARWELWRIAKSGGQPEQVTRYGGRFGMESHDGKSIYFVRPDTVGIWMRKLESLGEPRMAYADLDPRDWGNWSVASSGIYFVQRLAHAPVLSFLGFQSNRITRLQTLDKVPSDPVLSVAPDHSWFVYAQVDDEGSDIMVLQNLP
ncbi:MAG: winged helix-turn-helix domain-containing protein [Rhodothermales bacterium]